MYEFNQIGGLTYLKVKLFSSIPLIEHAFFTRRGGISHGNFQGLNISFDVGDEPSSVQENRSLIARAFGLQETDFLFLRQVHGSDIIVADGQDLRKPEADAVITRRRGLALAIKTADCVPILLCDPEAPAVAAIHAGWRGTAGKIAPRTVSLLEKTYGSRRESLLIAIGPSIRACCYEVDKAVFSQFESWEGSGASKRGNQFYLDLPIINARQLLASGIKEKNMVIVNLCTACEEGLFFSHRREKGITGRQLSFIMIK